MVDTVPNINRGLAKQVKHNIFVASYLFIVLFSNSSLVYLAFDGFPDIRLMMKIKAHSDFILNNLFMMFLVRFPINSGKPYFINKSDRTKNGNKDGNILDLNMFREKATEFRMSPPFVSTSYDVKSNMVIMVMLTIFTCITIIFLCF